MPLLDPLLSFKTQHSSLVTWGANDEIYNVSLAETAIGELAIAQPSWRVMRRLAASPLALVVQRAHYFTDTELVEGGQLLALYLSHGR